MLRLFNIFTERIAAGLLRDLQIGDPLYRAVFLRVDFPGSRWIGAWPSSLKAVSGPVFVLAAPPFYSVYFAFTRPPRPASRISAAILLALAGVLLLIIPVPCRCGPSIHIR